MAYKFQFRRIQYPLNTAVRLDWGGGVPVSIIADTEPEAYEKLMAISGPPAVRGWAWEAELRSIEALPVEPEATHD